MYFIKVLEQQQKQEKGEPVWSRSSMVSLLSRPGNTLNSLHLYPYFTHNWRWGYKKQLQVSNALAQDTSKNVAA